MKHAVVLSLLSIILAAVSCQKQAEMQIVSPDRVSVTLQFNAVVDSAPLSFNTEFRNYLNEPYTVSAFKFYICKIGFVDAASGTVNYAAGDSHYLIDAGNAGSTSISFQVEPSQYDAMIFTIGVDSLRNMSGAQTGALDPAKGMFWTWNSGYIMAKLEGHSPVSGEPNNKIEYHIGGFKGDENVLQQVQLAIPPSGADFTAGSDVNMSLAADVNAWFHHSSDLSIAANPVCAMPGPLAKTISENYASMFRLIDIGN